MEQSYGSRSVALPKHLANIKWRLDWTKIIQSKSVMSDFLWSWLLSGDSFLRQTWSLWTPGADLAADNLFAGGLETAPHQRVVRRALQAVLPTQRRSQLDRDHQHQNEDGSDPGTLWSLKTVVPTVVAFVSPARAPRIRLPLGECKQIERHKFLWER